MFECLDKQLNLPIDECELKIFKKAAVAADNYQSALNAKRILERNGSAVDAAITAGLVNSIVHSHHNGIGGGNFMVIYLKEKKIVTIDAKETAPSRINNVDFSNKLNKHGHVTKGGIASCIPGDLAGYWLAHQIGGRLPWKTLFEPAIRLCRNGVLVTRIISEMIAEEEQELRNHPELAQVYVNPMTNKMYKQGDVIYFPKLANTLEIISEKGADAFYNGELSQIIVQENNDNGGVWTIDDLKNYKAIERNPISVQLNDNYRAYALPPPSSGVLVLFIMSVMKHFNLNKDTLKTPESTALFYHRLLETFKHAFAKRSYLGDIDFVDSDELIKSLTDPDAIKKIVEMIDDNQTFEASYYNPASTPTGQHGTTQISVIAPNGDAVALTASVNTYFGAKYCGEKTGIIYNAHMDDFSIPGIVNYFCVTPSEANCVKPGKRPLSSMSPLIVLDKNDDVKFVIGSSGGTRIVTAIALITLRNIFLDIDVKSALDQNRCHHQLFPSNCEIENLSEEIKDMIRKKGHEIKVYLADETYVNAIERRSNGELWAVSDSRHSGQADGF